MNKNNPINSVYLVALACVSIMLYVDSFYQALVFAVVISAVFLFAISVVSMIDKIADKHVKFLTFALISALLITILKIVFQYVNVKIVVLMANYIDIAIVPCLLMSIVPIYFEDSLSVKQFFTTSLLMSACTILMILVFGLITEILGYGYVFDVAIKIKGENFAGIEFFKMPYGKLMLLAIITVLFNIVRRAYLKSTRRFEMLVEKYKIQIREIRSANQRENAQGGEQ